jgi:hypothetical protein
MEGPRAWFVQEPNRRDEGLPLTMSPAAREPTSYPASARHPQRLPLMCRRTGRHPEQAAPEVSSYRAGGPFGAGRRGDPALGSATSPPFSSGWPGDYHFLRETRESCRV